MTPPSATAARLDITPLPLPEKKSAARSAPARADRPFRGIAMILASISTGLVLGTALKSQGRVELRPVNLLPEGNRLPYSDAVFAGNLLYISSRIGTDPETGKRPEDPAQEARAALNSIKSVVSL